MIHNKPQTHIGYRPCILQEIPPARSINDYIRENGQPDISGGYLNLYAQNLTSLEGIENINNGHLVTAINLAHNNIETIPANTLGHFPDLQLLDLSHNRIRRITDRAFIDLLQLQHLYLQNNYINVGDFAQTFVYTMPNLLTLDVSYNDLRGPLLPMFFTGIPMIQDLNLSHNSITSIIQPNILPFNLQKLDVSHNKINWISPQTFSRTGWIEYLDLSYNELDDNLGNTGIIGGRLAPDLPQTFSEMRNLQTLDIRGNYLCRKVEEFIQFFRIRDMTTVLLDPQNEQVERGRWCELL